MKSGNYPLFVLVSSDVQNTQYYKPVSTHAMFGQPDAGARRRSTTFPDEQSASPGSNSAAECAAKPCTASVFPVAIPLADVMSAKTSWQ